MEDNQSADICRVCRCEGTTDKPLYHPCICTGSIKYIHQECLVQWLRYSEKEFCELCNYRFSFIPIYSPDMPKRLPLKDIFSVCLRCLGTAARYWFQCTLVALLWLVLIPLMAYQIYMFLFNYSFDDILSFKFEIFKTENLFFNELYGFFVVMCTLFTFIFLLWLREQIIRVGAPDWLERPFNLGLLHILFPGQNNVENQDEEPAEELINNNIADQEEEEDVQQINPDNEVLDDEVDNENPQDEILEDLNIENDIDDEDLSDINEEENVDEVQNEENPPLGNELVVAQDWNPVIEWDRGAEDITLERILGLDGTFAFLENVFWVITLNTLFIFIFAYCPYHIGNFLFKKLKIEKIVSPQFDRFIIIFIGYLLIGFKLFLMHILMSLTRFNRLQRVFGFCYIIVKVALLVTLEIGIFPTMVGWWLDICSFPLFDTSLQNRIDNFFSSPGISIFFHWLVGMFFIFYFLSFIILVKEIVRPGIIWFIVRNLNDPNFNFVNEMINLSVVSHIRHCILSFIIFGTTILLLIYIPVCLIQKFIPNFLPYNNVANNDSTFSTEFPIELIFIQLFLPLVIDYNDHNNSRKCIKQVIRTWCQVVAYVLDLKSFLLREDTNDNENIEDDADNESSQNYQKPNFFYLRVTLLIVAFCVTLLSFGIFTLIVPILIGRHLINDWFGDIKFSEINTAACGLYAIVASIRFCNFLVRALSRGWTQLVSKFKEWIPILYKIVISAFVLLGVIPLMVGFLLDVVVLMPLRVPHNQTPIFYMWQDWAFGVLLTNVICALAMMTDLRFKDNLEQIYNNGLANINLKMIMTEIAIPNLAIISLILALPYVTSKTLLPLFGASLEIQNLVNRRIHSILFITALAFFLIKYQINKFTRFYEHIRNDKYLVGQRLVNYEPNKSTPK